jgi:hypothetical protein
MQVHSLIGSLGDIYAFLFMDGRSSTRSHSARATAWAYRAALRMSRQLPVATRP